MVFIVLETFVCIRLNVLDHGIQLQESIGDHPNPSTLKHEEVMIVEDEMFGDQITETEETAVLTEKAILRTIDEIVDEIVIMIMMIGEVPILDIIVVVIERLVLFK